MKMAVYCKQCILSFHISSWNLWYFQIWNGCSFFICKLVSKDWKIYEAYTPSPSKILCFLFVCYLFYKSFQLNKIKNKSGEFLPKSEKSLNKRCMENKLRYFDTLECPCQSEETSCMTIQLYIKWKECFISSPTSLFNFIHLSLYIQHPLNNIIASDTYTWKSPKDLLHHFKPLKNNNI